MSERFDRLKGKYHKLKQQVLTQSEQLANDAKTVYERAVGERVVIGVTGLSRSGKSAFITSFIDQLSLLSTARLAGFGAAVSGRIVSVEVARSEGFKPFEYQAAKAGLVDTPSKWPVATTAISSTELHIYYKHVKTKPAKRLIVELVDYPGELLFDLSMLALDYQQWSQHWLAQHDQDQKKSIVQGFVNLADDANGHRQHFDSFVAVLKQLKESGYSQVSPGHMLLTPELYRSADKLFVPYVGTDDALYQQYQQNYERYRANELAFFVEQVFNRQDRQVVLVDLLQSLTKGESVFNDQRQALDLIVGHTLYAKQNRLVNALSPKVSKVVFACSKADQVLSADHDDLRQLLFDVVKATYEKASVEGVSPICEAIAAIRSSNEIDHRGQRVLAGHALDSGEQLGYVNPGITTHIPDTDEEWAAYTTWQYKPLAPPVCSINRALPHIRIDSVLNHLLEDLL